MGTIRRTAVEEAAYQEMARAMTAQHWRIEGLGGGNDAYVQVINEGRGKKKSGHVEYMCTWADENGNTEPSIPLSLDDAVVLGYYEYGKDRSAPAVTSYFRGFASVRAMLQWFDVAEYVLPENGEGPVANGWTPGA